MHEDPPVGRLRSELNSCNNDKQELLHHRPTPSQQCCQVTDIFHPMCSCIRSSTLSSTVLQSSLGPRPPCKFFQTAATLCLQCGKDEACRQRQLSTRSLNCTCRTQRRNHKLHLSVGSHLKSLESEIPTDFSHESSHHFPGRSFRVGPSFRILQCLKSLCKKNQALTLANPTSFNKPGHMLHPRQRRTAKERKHHP